MCSNIKLLKKDKNKFWLFNKEVSENEFKDSFQLGFTEKNKVCDKCGQEINWYDTTRTEW